MPNRRVVDRARFSAATDRGEHRIDDPLSRPDPAAWRALRFRHPGEARAFLVRGWGGAGGLARLRHLLARLEPGLARAAESDAAVLDRLAQALASGRLAAHASTARLPALPGISGDGADSEPPPPDSVPLHTTKSVDLDLEGVHTGPPRLGLATGVSAPLRLKLTVTVTPPP
jgi:hypothetical protein